MEIILFEPEIPQNTGNIVRTCSVTGAKLTLVRPLGFSTSSRMLKRAGLDYWDEVNIHFVDDLEIYLKEKASPTYFFSSHATKPYTEISYTENDCLVFGSESTGLPKQIHENWCDQFYTLPMKPNARCLNLANTASIVLYEALRQLNFAPLGT